MSMFRIRFILYFLGYKYVLYFSRKSCAPFVISSSISMINDCQVYSVDWSPDGTRVASGGKDKVLKM